MNHPWFQFPLRICIGASVIGILLAERAAHPVFAQDAATPTPGGPAPTITVTYIEPINVRTGPSTVYYPIIGQLPVGATAAALGKSPSSAWIEIAYAPGPGGVGWVYAANVTLSPGFLQIVEPPPTATPLATDTLDPTFVAQFTIQPTSTRLPTFTPPAPLVIPTYQPSNQAAGQFPMGTLILVIGVIGMVFLLFSLISRR